MTERRLVSLAEVPGALQPRLGLPRPDWETISEWLTANVAEGDLSDAWADAARQWLTELSRSLRGHYRVEESDNFLVLTELTGRQLGQLLRRCEMARHEVLRMLPDIASDEGYGKHVALVISRPRDYYTYVADYDQEGEYGGSSGCFIPDIYGHIAVQGRELWVILPTLTHEITHAALRHRDLPRWLEEGLVRVVEQTVEGEIDVRLDRELRQRHLEHWHEHGLRGFWSGEAFHAADEAQELSYSLAHILTVNLMTDHGRRFLDFVAAARWQDDGDAAAREVLGVGLDAIAATFLGSGDWRQ